MTASVAGLHQRRRHTVVPSASSCVVISIALGDLAFFVLRLACDTLPLRRLVSVEYRLLRERRLSQNDVRALELL
jgi:hypothetical protein